MSYTDAELRDGNDNLLALAELLEHDPDPEKFTMEAFHHPCGTPACALGHASRFLEGCPNVLDQDGVLAYFALSCDEELELFSGCGCDGAVTPGEAAAYIRRFVWLRQNPGETVASYERRDG